MTFNHKTAKLRKLSDVLTHQGWCVRRHPSFKLPVRQYAVSVTYHKLHPHLFTFLPDSFLDTLSCLNPKLDPRKGQRPLKFFIKSLDKTKKKRTSSQAQATDGSVKRLQRPKKACMLEDHLLFQDRVMHTCIGQNLQTHAIKYWEPHSAL